MAELTNGSHVRVAVEEPTMNSTTTEVLLEAAGRTHRHQRRATERHLSPPSPRRVALGGSLARVCVVAALAVSAAGMAAAEPPRLELGLHAASLAGGDAGTSSVGLGGRVTAHVTAWLSVDGDVSVFPSNRLELISTINGESVGLIYNRRRVDAFIGPTVGVRGDRIGVFARLRPGFTRLADRGVDCLQVCALILIMPPQYVREFALDAGATVEVYLTPRVLARIDIGDTMIRHRRTAPPYRDDTSHTLAARLGLGFRF